MNGFSDADADVPVMNLEQIGRRAILKVSVSEEAIVIPWRSWPDVPLGLKSKEPSVYIWLRSFKHDVAVQSPCELDLLQY